MTKLLTPAFKNT